MKKILTIGAVTLVALMLMVSCSENITAPDVEEQSYNGEEFNNSNKSVNLIYGTVYADPGPPLGDTLESTVELWFDTGCISQETGSDGKFSFPMNQYSDYWPDNLTLVANPDEVGYATTTVNFYYDGGSVEKNIICKKIFEGP